MPIDPNAPWANDFGTFFAEGVDPEDAFDRYMREKQQPYITQLEESTKDARELWADLQDETKVESTVRELFTSVYADDPDAGVRYDKLFEAIEPIAETPAAEVTPPTDDIPEWAKPIVETYQQQRDREATEAAAAEYANAKLELQGAHPDLTDDDLGLIDPFVYGAGGDMEKAYGAYNAWREKAGVAPAPPVVEDAPPTPPVVDGGRPTPPLATQFTKYDQVGDAFEAFRARQAASLTPPPVVG